MVVPSERVSLLGGGCPFERFKDRCVGLAGHVPIPTTASMSTVPRGEGKTKIIPNTDSPLDIAVVSQELVERLHAGGRFEVAKHI
jgi:hypothetical protein